MEFEQGGAEHAELYGKRLIDKLSRELKTLGLKGISSTSLRQCRTFYLAYKKIGQTVPAQSSDALIAFGSTSSNGTAGSMAVWMVWYQTKAASLNTGAMS